MDGVIKVFKKLKQEVMEFRMTYKVKPESSLGIKYPTLRDHPLHTSSIWLEGKRADDGAEGLWRIHDDLYDFSDFINTHPGGRDWLSLTKGTDITEAFESHHLTANPKLLLPKYSKKRAKERRNSPFTFKETGFYITLKKKVCEKLRNLPQKPLITSKIYADALFLSYIGLFILAVSLRSFSIAAISGVCLAMTAIAAHNFFHKRDNFRMYYFDFTFMSSKEWRVSHALSHHLYTNTINDLEISALEPWLQYLPFEKFYIFRYGSWLYSPIVYAAMFFAYFTKSLVSCFKDGIDQFSWTMFLPISVPLMTVILTGASLGTCFSIFLFNIVVSSIYFGIVGVNAAHHDPDIFHDGDLPRYQDQDWGIHQIDATRDRTDINSSHFLVITNFGDHTLHHLFPTIDHGHLHYLYPVFLETCEEFGIEFKPSTQVELTFGQYRQLSKIKPRTSQPKALKNKRRPDKPS